MDFKPRIGHLGEQLRGLYLESDDFCAGFGVLCKTSGDAGSCKWLGFLWLRA